MEEIWKPIKGFEDLYAISNYGRVKRLVKFSVDSYLLRERILKTKDSDFGTLSVQLAKDGVRVQKKINFLVAEAFIQNPKNLRYVIHIDGNKKNNTFTNLKWSKKGTSRKSRRPLLKLTKDEISEIFDMKCKGVKQIAIAKRFNISQSHVSFILSGKRCSPKKSLDILPTPYPSYPSYPQKEQEHRESKEKISLRRPHKKFMV